MRFDFRGLSALQIALATVLGVFAFLSTFFSVSDRFGGGPVGYLVSILLALVVFFFALAIAPRFVAKAIDSKPRQEIPPSSTPTTGPTMIVQTPVHVNVPVNVRVEREREIATTREAPITAKEEGTRPPVATPTPSTLATSDDSFETPPGEETIFDDVVDVNTGREGCWYRELPLKIGDILEADLHVVEGDEVNWMIMTKKNFFAWLDGGDPRYARGEENVRAMEIKWNARKGKWYFVVDAFLKHYPRKVSIRLRRVRARP